MRRVVPERPARVKPGATPQVVRLLRIEYVDVYGPSYRCAFEAVAIGVEFTHWTTEADAIALFEALMDRVYAPGDVIDTDELIGRTCEAVIGRKESGHLRIVASQPLGLHGP